MTLATSTAAGSHCMRRIAICFKIAWIKIRNGHQKPWARVRPEHLPRTSALPPPPWAPLNAYLQLTGLYLRLAALSDIVLPTSILPAVVTVSSIVCRDCHITCRLAPSSFFSSSSFFSFFLSIFFFFCFLNRICSNEDARRKGQICSQ